METGEKMGFAEWRPAVMQETGGDFLMVKVSVGEPETHRLSSFSIPQHEDVHRLLYKLAVSAGAEVVFGAVVTAVTPGEPKPSVTLASGEVYTADIVLGADGPNSFVRSSALSEKPEGKLSGYSVFGTVIPGDEMAKDPELATWLTADEVNGPSNVRW